MSAATTPATQKTRSRNHKCQECAKGFHTRGQLRNHLSVHNLVKPFQCHCGDAFATAWRLDTHAKNVHCTARVYRCEVCAKMFKTSSHLRAHGNVHRATARASATDRLPAG